MSVRIPLIPSQFGPGLTEIARMGKVTASSFRYASGIEALRITTGRADVIVLPFMGQQVWRAVFAGRDISMGSMFEEPVATPHYLQTYGAFFIHCGVTAIGAPGLQDKHPLHGELPLARFETAVLVLDEAVGTVVLEGSYRHRVAFSTNYTVSATITLGVEATALDFGITVQNNREAPMDLMYLGHANFKPVLNGELIYSAHYDPEHVAVRKSVPAHIMPPPGYAGFVDRLASDPALHHVLMADLPFEPEVVFSVTMESDADGLAHAMQVHPDGQGDFISYRTDTLPMAIRWICRTSDQQGLGLALPSTSGVEGYTAEKAAGRVTVVPPKGVWSAWMRTGSLDAADAATMRAQIERQMGRA
jgi:hypothetical protein